MKVWELIDKLNMLLDSQNSEVITNDGQPIENIEIVKEDIFLSADFTTQGTYEYLKLKGKLQEGITKVVEKGTIVLC